MKLVWLLREAGATVRLDGGKVIVGKASALPHELLDRAKAEKPRLLAELEQEARNVADILDQCSRKGLDPMAAMRFLHRLNAFLEGETIDRHELLSLGMEVVYSVPGSGALEGQALWNECAAVFPRNPHFDVEHEEAPRAEVDPAAFFDVPEESAQEGLF